MKTWLVTGAGRGLGLAIAKAALAAGNRVIATARDPSALKNALGGPGPNLLALPLDVTSLAAATSVASEAHASFGGVDILVNNAGYGHLGWFEEASDQEVRRQFEVNLFGAMNVTRAILPIMRAQRSGRIMMISSTAGFNGVEGSSLYAASKFALEGWSQGLAQEVAPLGIKVIIIGPGGFRTDFLDPSSVRYAPASIADYAQARNAFEQRLNNFNHAQGGDPAKLAEVLVELAAMPDPPARFAAGSDAVSGFRRKLDAYRSEADAFEAQSRSTDFLSDPG